MSVRTSFEADMVGLTRHNQNQALSDLHISLTESSADASRESNDLNFGDNLRAHLNSQDSKNCRSERDNTTSPTEDPSLSSSAAANATDHTNPTRGSVPTVADQQGPCEIASTTLAGNSRAKLVAPAAPQKQSSNIRGYKTAVATSATKSISAGTTNSDANNVAAGSNAIALLNPIGVVAAPDQSGPIGSIVIAVSDPAQNSSTSSTISIDGSNTSTTPTSWAISQRGYAQSKNSTSWESTGGNDQMAVTRVNETIGGHEATNAGSPEAETDHALPFQTHPRPSSGFNASAGSQPNNARAQNSASDVVTAAEMESKQHASPDPSTRTGAKQDFVISPSLSASTEYQIQIHSRPIDANSDSVQSAPNAATLEAILDVRHPADPQASLTAAISKGVVGAIGTSKSSSSRSAQNGTHSQNSRSILANSADALATRVPDISRITEVTNGSSTNQKITDAISSDGRLQNTFSSLEPVARNVADAFDWTRTGHMQAEAGYQDPALGWIGIRAESTGGAVHAMLVLPSADAAQVLSGHVAGLHAYLAENHTPVETLTLSSFCSNAQQFTDQNTGQGPHHGSEQNGSQSNAPEATPEPQTPTSAATAIALRDGAFAHECFTRSNGRIGSEGVHISVLA